MTIHTLSTQSPVFQKIINLEGREWGRKNQVWKLWIETFVSSKPSHTSDVAVSPMSKHKSHKAFKLKIAFFSFFSPSF